MESAPEGTLPARIRSGLQIKNDEYMDQIGTTDELRLQRAEIRKQNAPKYRQKLAGLRDLIATQRKKTIELMRRRHAHYSKLINDAKIKTAQEFYDRFKDQFQMYGIELKLSDDKSTCSIYLELEANDYEQYWVEDGRNDGLASVSPIVAFQDWFTNLEINIFTGKYV